jgi:ATP-dependent Clp protease adapter protein ClpS
MNHRPTDPTGLPANHSEPPPAHRRQPAASVPFQLPRYKVVLHNDVAVELMFVVRTVMELTRLCRAEATHKMWEAYHQGRSILLTTYRERAELYVEQFGSKGLTVSIEPV